MKKILIDMDDVICGTGKVFLDFANRCMNTNYTFEDIPTYYIQDLVSKEKIKEYEKMLFHAYDEIDIIPGAADAIEKLNKIYDVYVVTAYVTKGIKALTPDHVKNKLIWLRNNLPFLEERQFIFAENKQMISGEIIIDDKLSNLKGNRETKLLFEAYHNQTFDDNELKKENIIPVKTWQEIEKVLIK